MINFIIDVVQHLVEPLFLETATTDVVVIVDMESPKAVVVVTHILVFQECVGSILCCHSCGTGRNDEYGEHSTM